MLPRPRMSARNVSVPPCVRSKTKRPQHHRCCGPRDRPCGPGRRSRPTPSRPLPPGRAADASACRPGPRHGHGRYAVHAQMLQAQHLQHEYRVCSLSMHPPGRPADQRTARTTTLARIMPTPAHPGCARRSPNRSTPPLTMKSRSWSTRPATSARSRSRRGGRPGPPAGGREPARRPSVRGRASRTPGRVMFGCRRDNPRRRPDRSPTCSHARDACSTTTSRPWSRGGPRQRRQPAACRITGSR